MTCPKDLSEKYKKLKVEVDARLGEFAALWQAGSDGDIWREMCFCTCTPQNDAKRAWNAVLAADSKGLLQTAKHEQIALFLQKNGVRFHNNKAKYITHNRENFFPNTKRTLQTIVSTHSSIVAARNALSKTVMGWGLKEASHFLRNVGFGGSLCILDRHILRQLQTFGAIEAVPKSITTETYLNIEQKMLHFAKSVHIPPDALDLVFWHEAKQELFK